MGKSTRPRRTKSKVEEEKEEEKKEEKEKRKTIRRRRRRRSQRRRRLSLHLLPTKSNKLKLRRRPPSQSPSNSRKNWRRPTKRSLIPPRKLSNKVSRSPRTKASNLKRRKTSRKPPEDSSDKNVPSCSQLSSLSSPSKRATPHQVCAHAKAVLPVNLKLASLLMHQKKLRRPSNNCSLRSSLSKPDSLCKCKGPAWEPRTNLSSKVKRAQ